KSDAPKKFSMVLASLTPAIIVTSQPVNAAYLQSCTASCSAPMITNLEHAGSVCLNTERCVLCASERLPKLNIVFFNFIKVPKPDVGPSFLVKYEWISKECLSLMHSEKAFSNASSG